MNPDKDYKVFGYAGLLMPPDDPKSLQEKLRHHLLAEIAKEGYELQGDIQFGEPSNIFLGGHCCNTCGHCSKLRSEFQITATAWGTKEKDGRE